jgi:ankyrin repeat protein
VTYLAENGCHINSASANNAPCLHVACENGHFTTMEYLLKHAAEVNAINSANQTLIHIVASWGQTKIVELSFKTTPTSHCEIKMPLRPLWQRQ